MIVCLAANPSVDKLFEIERLVPGGIHRPDGFVQVAGGKGLNVARAGYALGADVRAVALLRGHTGKWIEEQLAAEGVAATVVWTHGENRSSLSVADRETGGLTEFYEHGAEVHATAWTEVLHEVAGLLPSTSWMTISGSLPRGAPDDGYREAVAEAVAAGVKVAVDSEGARLSNALEAGPDIVKVNAAEAGGLLQIATDTVEGAIEAATQLRERAGGDGHAGIVTRGADGVVLCAPDGTCWEGRLYVQGRYPVGSGDAFLAGLVVSLEAGDSWVDALAMALAAATANAELPGAGRLDPVRARALAKKASVRPP